MNAGELVVSCRQIRTTIHGRKRRACASTFVGTNASHHAPESVRCRAPHLLERTRTAWSCIDRSTTVALKCCWPLRGRSVRPWHCIGMKYDRITGYQLLPFGEGQTAAALVECCAPFICPSVQPRKMFDSTWRVRERLFRTLPRVLSGDEREYCKD